MERLDQHLIGRSDHERTPDEVWTLVLGDHRPVSAFNPGKRAERCLFRETKTH